jgi:uncharacterized membrane protein
MVGVLKKSADTNISERERWASMIGGTGLIAYGVARRDGLGAGLALLGGALAWRGASGHSDVYQALGIHTAPRGYAKGTGADAGVPYELGIRVDQEVRIQKSKEELYRFWRKLENLPRFMHHLESVQETPDGNSHWVVKGPAGVGIRWEAEIVNDIPNEVIGWRSLPGSQVDNGGSVRFESAPDGSTIVKVSLQYNPPAGAVGDRIARMFGEDPRDIIRDDLRRFKELMETGIVSSSERGAKRPADEERRRWRAEDNVENASAESFPASDSPSWTPGVL